MTKKIGDKKIDGVTSTRQAESVKEALAVSEVQNVKATSGVGTVKSTGSVRSRQSTRVMSLEEREQLFKMIGEEADTLFKGSGMSEQRKQMVQNAVKMAVDAGLLEEE